MTGVRGNLPGRGASLPRLVVAAAMLFGLLAMHGFSSFPHVEMSGGGAHVAAMASSIPTAGPVDAAMRDPGAPIPDGGHGTGHDLLTMCLAILGAAVALFLAVAVALHRRDLLATVHALFERVRARSRCAGRWRSPRLSVAELCVSRT